MGAFNILTLTCRLGRYSERPSLSFFLDCFVVENKGAMPTGSRRRLQWPRGLSKHVPPSRRRAHIHIAEPQLVIEALPFLCAVGPQKRRNNLLCRSTHERYDRYLPGAHT